ncbi:MAG: MBL fold metallo-hydrolase [Methanomicrobiales archaeon]|nr:MBL fold metallo-hydrolase [Methanomicrobiales archaeon]
MTEQCDLLENQHWQPVPGNEHAEIFPCIRKVDTNSSNSYIISTPSQIILIDPGGSMEQMDLLATEIERVRAAKPRPVYIYLTHTHVDHFVVMQSHPFFSGPGRAIIAAHAAGAASLEAADTATTQADMFQVKLSPMHVSIQLFAPHPGSDTGFFEICPLAAPFVRVRDGDKKIGDNLILKRQVVFSGPIDRIEVYSLPGHSRDSICIRVGGLLFIGDLQVAASPGVAGIRGWSQQELLLSLQKVRWLLENEEIMICCPGHGRPISSASADAVFATMEKETCFLADVREINPGWAKQTAEYANDLMNRVAETFTIMAGRCYRAAHILEELGETGEAENLSGLVCLESIDSILADFHRFNEDYHAGNQRDVHLAMKAGQITAKLETVYRAGQLDLVIGPHLVKRAERLLSDYMTLFRGFLPTIEREEFELDAFVGHCITTLVSPPCSDEDLISLADDEARYRQALVKRLVYVPVFEENPVLFVPSGYPFSVVADRGRLTDLIMSILEEMAGTGGQHITVSDTKEMNRSFVTIRAEFSSPCTDFPGDRPGFMIKECEFSGGSFTSTKEGDVISTVIELPAV